MAPTTKLDRAMLARVLGRQHDVISRDQVVRCGMTQPAIRHRIRSEGPWTVLLPGVYLAKTGAPSARQLDMAAMLHAGPHSVITGWAAMRRFGLEVPDTQIVDVLVPHNQRPQSTGFVRIHRSMRLPEFSCVDGVIRFVRPARAVADTARGLTGLRDVRALVAGAVQRQWCSLAELNQELAQGSNAGSALLRQVLSEVADGIRSVAEGDLHDLIISARLPTPMYNARLFAGATLLAAADAWWPTAGVAAEVDSRQWHLSPEDWEQTMARHAKMTAAGILVLHFTPRQIRAEPDEVAALIKEALDGAAGRTRPRIRALPATA